MSSDTMDNKMDVGLNDDDDISWGADNLIWSRNSGLDFVNGGIATSFRIFSHELETVAFFSPFTLITSVPHALYTKAQLPTHVTGHKGCP